MTADKVADKAADIKASSKHHDVGVNKSVSSSRR